MEARNTQTPVRPSNLDEYENRESGELVRQRLNELIAVNAETERQKSLYRSDYERVEAEMMANPLNAEKAFGYFGLMLGTFPPAAIFAKFLADTNEGYWLIGIMLVMNLITAIVGFSAGKLISRQITAAEGFSIPVMLLITPLIGVLWGLMTGGAGGVIIFGVGAFFGAIIAAAVGAAAFPVFTLAHRSLKKGEMMEMKHFLPVAFGVTFSICSFILGY